jgi:predicted nucleotidyltransferase
LFFNLENTNKNENSNNIITSGSNLKNKKKGSYNNSYFKSNILSRTNSQKEARDSLPQAIDVTTSLNTTIKDSNDKGYVSNLVKNMVNQIISDESNKIKQMEQEKISRKNTETADITSIDLSKIDTVDENKIETINHEILPEKKNRMVDNFSQTEKKELVELVMAETDSEIIMESTSAELKRSDTMEDVDKKKKKKVKPNKFPINNFKVEPKKPKPVELKKSVSEQFTGKNDIEVINTTNFKVSNTNSFKKPQQFEDYFVESEDSYFGKSNKRSGKDNSYYNYNNGYGNNNYYSKKNKFSNNSNNYYGNGANHQPQANNKFGGDTMANTKLSGRMYYGRNDYFYHDEPKVFNNYYIINSNVNINNVQNSEENEIDGNMMCNNDLHQPHPFYYSNFKESKCESINYDILSKIDEDIYPFIFHYKIHNDILDYSNTVNETHEYLKEVKIYIVNYIETIIKQCLGDVVISIYGSFATNLCIESSDIDMTIKFSEDVDYSHDQEEIISKLCEYFRSCNFDSVNPIVKAAVPIIKLVVDPATVLDVESKEYKLFKAFKYSDIFRNYRFNIEDLLKVKVDLTILEYNSTYNTKVVVDWAKKSIETYPEIRPIIHVLKRYLQIRRLNSSFNGNSILI